MRPCIALMAIASVVLYAAAALPLSFPKKQADIDKQNIESLNRLRWGHMFGKRELPRLQFDKFGRVEKRAAELPWGGWSKDLDVEKRSAEFPRSKNGLSWKVGIEKRSAECLDVASKVDCTYWNNKGFCSAEQFKDTMSVQCAATCHIC